MRLLLLIAVVAIVCWLMPPFRIVPLKLAEASKAQAAFDPAEFAASFWKERLEPALGQASEAGAVLDALSKDPKSAATNYGRTLGMSDAVYYLVRGTGAVVAVEEKGVALSLKGPGHAPDLVLKTGLVFGNAVRDVTGLLRPGEFPNSQDFNAISTELNRIVEARVIPVLKTNAAVGRRLRFVAAGETEAETEIDRPLKVVPLKADFE